MQIITENKTTKPPIITTVEVALFKLLDNISPKFEIHIFEILFSDLVTLYVLKVEEFFFQNLKNMPTVKAPKM